MASVTIKSNIVHVGQQIRDKLGALTDETILRPVMFGLVDLMTQRIHIEGEDSSGNQIGTYSKGYLRTRAKANRKEGSKVVISLTRQLENAWTVEATPKGYGIGFLNQHNYDKSQWVEATYKKPIFELTQKEREYAVDYISDLVKEKLSE